MSAVFIKRDDTQIEHYIPVNIPHLLAALSCITTTWWYASTGSDIFRTASGLLGTTRVKSHCHGHHCKSWLWCSQLWALRHCSTILPLSSFSAGPPRPSSSNYSLSCVPSVSRWFYYHLVGKTESHFSATESNKPKKHPKLTIPSFPQLQQSCCSISQAGSATCFLKT